MAFGPLMIHNHFFYDPPHSDTFLLADLLLSLNAN